MRLEGVYACLTRFTIGKKCIIICKIFFKYARDDVVE